MLKVLEDLKYQFDDRIAESEYSKDEDLLEALESNKMASEALDMAIKTLEQPNVDKAENELLVSISVIDKIKAKIETLNFDWGDDLNPTARSISMVCDAIDECLEVERG